MESPREELHQLDDLGLRRSLRRIDDSRPPRVTIDGQELLNFSSNDYLGLSRHPALAEAAKEAIERYGTSSTASRLVCGSLDFCHQLALTFANGYATAMGTIPAIVGKKDTIILDKLSHACLIDAAKLSGATLRVFPHNELGKLDKLLSSAKGRILVVTESVFSMDGDQCPLAEIVALKNKHHALLFLDEAHAVGVVGPNGQGLAEELSLQEDVDFQMGTLGKALGSAGGYLAASREWIDLFINKSRSFIYSTAPPPSQAAASIAALKILASEEGQLLRKKLSDHLAGFHTNSPIIPLIVGDNEDALTASRSLLNQGFLVPAIRYPTVPRGTARLRITLSAAHSPEDLSRLKQTLSSLETIPSFPKPR